MLGQLTGEDETDGGLDLAGRDGGLLVVGGELGGLSCDALEDVLREMSVLDALLRVELDFGCAYR